MPDLKYVQEWIAFSVRDYEVSLHLYQTFNPTPAGNICFGCQQAVEKALKAILVYNDTEIPKTHDISKLNTLCREYTDKLEIDTKIARKLTSFASESRYPDSVFEFTQEDAEFGLKHAKIVLDKVKEILNLPCGND